MRPSTIKDLAALTKPRIVLLTVLMAALGLWLAPGSIAGGAMLVVLVGTALSVGSANALNMYLERERDGRMARTRGRPLPAGRLRPATALVFGLVLGVVGVGALAVWTTPLAAIVSAFALLTYTLVYTPLKPVTDFALLIGAIPGAAPPVIGWAAVTGRLDMPAIALFGILFLWQIPHFLAIALCHKTDYARAGIRITPVVHGDRAAKRQALIFSLGLVAASLTLVPLRAASWPYAVVALAVGAWFIVLAQRGLSERAGPRWARQLFLASLAYLPILCAGLVVDRLIA